MAKPPLQSVYKRAEKPLKGHKGRPVIGFSFSCECGWEGAWSMGKGARTQAANEFYWHKVACLKADAGGSSNG